MSIRLWECRNAALSAPYFDVIVSFADNVLVDAFAVLENPREVSPHGDTGIIALVDVDIISTRCVGRSLTGIHPKGNDNTYDAIENEAGPTQFHPVEEQ